jgi:ELWxxDGT repeat protein
MPLPQFSPGAASTAFYGFAVVSGRVVVATETSSGRLQLYATDGSPPKPTQLTRFTGAQELSTAPGLMRISDRRSAFEVDAGSKKELWSTDGTPRGTRRVAEVALPFASGPSRIWLSSGGWLYFSGYRKAEGTEPWRTDGITAALLRDTCKGACSGFPSGFSESGGEIFFEAFSPARHPTYWHTRAGGSRIAVVLRPQSTAYPLGNLLGVIDGALLVIHATLHEGLEPWTWRPGVDFRQLRDVNPTTSPADSNPRDFQAFDGKTVLLANDASLGPAVWVSDGTAPGSRRLEARGSPTFERLAETATTAAGLFLLAGQYQSGRGFPTRIFAGALWLWDGASPFVERLTPHGVRVAQGLVAVQNQLFFCANGVLWKSDGSVAGTRDLRDAVGDYCVSVAGSMGGQAYFLTPMALWRTDGTSAGTTPVLALPSGIAHLGETGVLGSRIFFLARRTTGQSSCPNLELWRWDEIEGAQAIVLESQDCLLWLGASLSPLGPNRLLATAHSNSSTTLTSETRLWLTDGTAAGTHFVARTATPATSQPEVSAVTLPLLSGATAESQPVVELAGRHFFMGPGDFTTRTLALWSSDGSVAGTRTHADIVPHGYRAADRVAILTALPPSSPWEAGGRVIMEVEDATSKRFFLETMGTPGSTVLHGRVEGEGPGTAEGRLFFSRKNEHGNELWVLEAQP